MAFTLRGKRVAFDNIAVGSVTGRERTKGSNTTEPLAYETFEAGTNAVRTTDALDHILTNTTTRTTGFTERNDGEHELGGGMAQGFRPGIPRQPIQGEQGEQMAETITLTKEQFDALLAGRNTAPRRTDRRGVGDGVCEGEPPREPAGADGEHLQPERGNDVSPSSVAREDAPERRGASGRHADVGGN